MKKIEEVIDTEILSNIVMEMYKDLLYQIKENKFLEIKELKNIFDCYFKECENEVESVEVTYFQTDKDYIEHYQDKLKKLEEEKKELKSQIDFYKNKENLK